MQPKNVVIDPYYKTLSSYYMKDVLYIAYIGKYYGEHLFKYGISNKSFKQDHKKYSDRLDEFEIVMIEECDACDRARLLFETHLEDHGFRRRKTLCGYSYTKLFTISTKYSHEYISNIMRRTVELINDIKFLDEIEIHKKKDESKRLEMEYKLSENYRLELQNNRLRIEKNNDARTKEVNDRLIEEKRKLEKLKIKLELVEQGYYVHIK